MRMIQTATICVDKVICTMLVVLKCDEFSGGKVWKSGVKESISELFESHWPFRHRILNGAQ